MPLSYEWIVRRPVCAAREKIKEIVCAEFGITVADLSGQGRARIYMDARCVYSHITRRGLADTLDRIGRELNRDHSAIVHQLKRIDDLIYIKDPIIERIARIEKQILKQTIDENNNNNTSDKESSTS